MAPAGGVLGGGVSPAASCLRLQRLQQLCLDAQLDALLLIAGTDGQDNEGCRGVLSYLFEGISPQETALVGGRRKPWLEECVGVVRPSGAEFYCARDATPVLLPHTAFWPATAVFCPTLQETQNAEVEEDYKLRTFLKMIAGLAGKRVGVPLSTPKPSAKKGVTAPLPDPMEVETWPLVQAYGVEGVGPGGFFTMRHTVVDASPLLAALYSRLDAPAGAALLEHETARMAQHWAELEALLDARSPSDRLDMTEAQVAEPLATFFAHASVRGGAPRDERTVPRVAFGTNSAEGRIQQTLGELRIAQAGVGGSPALHFVAECSAPTSGIHCARTYFLCTRPPCPVAAEDTAGLEDTTPPKEAGSDVALLARVYAGVVDAARAAIRHLAKGEGPSAESALEVARTVFEHSLPALVPPLSPLLHSARSLPPSLTLSTWACNSATGQPTPPLGGDLRVKVLRLALPSVESVEHPGESLGGVVFAESYLEHEGRLLLLTDSVPALSFWAGAWREEEQLCRQMALLRDRMALHQALGEGGRVRRLSQGEGEKGGGGAGGVHSPLGAPLQEYEESMRLATSAPALAPLEGTWLPFERGVLFVSPRFGPLWLDFAGGATRAAHIQRQEESHAPAALVLEIGSNDSAVQSYGPLALLPSEGAPLCIAFDLLALPPPSRRHFSRHVLPAWQELWQLHEVAFGGSLMLPVPPALLCTPPPPGTPTLHPTPPHKRFNVQAPDAAVEAFFQALALSEARQRCKELKWTPVKPGGGATVAGGVPITVLSGTPGSGKESLCRNLAMFLGNGRRWFVIASRVAHGPLDLDKGQLAADLALVAEALDSNSALPAHVLVVCPGLVPVLGVLAALAELPPLVEGRFFVSSVTACVSAALFLDPPVRAQPSPGALEQVRAGLVDNVILFDSANASPAQVAEVRALLRLCNPLARLIEASRGNLLEILDTAIMPLEDAPPAFGGALPQVTAELARLLLCPPSAMLPPRDIQAECLRCQGPLEVDTLQWELAALFAGDSVTEPVSPTRVATEGPKRPVVHHVLGFVRAPGGGVLRVSANRAAVAVTPQEESSPAMPLVGGGHGLSLGGEGGAAELVFVGPRPLDVEGIKRLLMKCQPQLRTERALRDVASLTAAELAAIAEQHKEAPLPDGWFFDGVNYVDAFGDRFPYHPLMDHWVGQFLDTVNAETRAYNAEVKAERDRRGLLKFL